MKDRNIIIGVVIMICVITLCLLYVFYNTPMNEDIKNINWYRYDIKSGIYDKLVIEDTELKYFYNNKNLEKCSKFLYNTRLKTITTDCDIEMKFKTIEDDYIILSIDEEDKVFFKNIEESLNYEFENYYEQSIIEYSDSKKEVKEILKIDFSKLNEIINNEKSIIVFEGNKCNNIDCVLLLGILEKWNVDSQNIYYIDSSDIILEDFIIKYPIFKEYKSLINGNYPLIFRIENNIIKNSELFRCNGLNCTSWKDYVK